MKIDDFYKIVDVLQREEFNDGSLKTLLFLSVFTGRRGAAPKNKSYILLRKVRQTQNQRYNRKRKARGFGECRSLGLYLIIAYSITIIFRSVFNPKR